MTFSLSSSFYPSSLLLGGGGLLLGMILLLLLRRHRPLAPSSLLGAFLFLTFIPLATLALQEVGISSSDQAAFSQQVQETWGVEPVRQEDREILGNYLTPSNINPLCTTGTLDAHVCSGPRRFLARLPQGEERYCFLSLRPKVFSLQELRTTLSCSQQDPSQDDGLGPYQPLEGEMGRTA